jgi:hypothetical protein
MSNVPQQPGPELNAYAAKIAAAWRQSLVSIAEQDASHLPAAVNAAMDFHLNRLAATRVWGPANRAASGPLWHILEPMLAQGSLQLHAREKPHGYAGDFRLLDRICERSVRGAGIGRAYDEFFQSHAAPNAVRNRANILAQAMQEFAAERRDMQIVSYGSGPAFELRTLCRKLTPESRRHLRITLLDLDPQALAFAKEQLCLVMPETQIVAERANLNRLPRGKAGKSEDLFPPADFVYASGFFDYLDQEQAVTTIRFFWQRMKPGGKMFIFNFGENNASRAYMEWVANWYLNYRTDEQMQSLATGSDLPSRSWSTGVEPAGVNRYLTAVKPL